MGEDFAKIKSRRQMMAGVLRYAALGLVGYFAGSAIVKRRRLIKEGKCIERGICSGCKVYQDCRLPPALSKKQVLYRKNHADKKS